MAETSLPEAEIAARLAGDGLPVRDVGHWSQDKHHFIRRYLHAFTTAMRGKWESLNYIDLFAGPGLCRIRESGSLILGSPLIAAQFPFDRLYLSDIDPQTVEALEGRLKAMQTLLKRPVVSKVFVGDANVVVDDVMPRLPAGSLSVALLDPTKLQVHFETVRRIGQHRVDLVILFPDHTDINRNYRDVYGPQSASKLDRVLGTTDWRQAVEQATSHDATIRAFRAAYRRQLASLGYEHIAEESVGRGGQQHLYALMFATKSEAGLRLWNGIARRERDGQGRLQFPME